MEKERAQPEDGFGFSRNEVVWDRVSQARLMLLLADDATQVHRVERSENRFGAFLFVTLSRPTAVGRAYVTFWGAGKHEYRDRWLTEEWFWYRAEPAGQVAESVLNKDEVDAIIRRRLEEIAPYAAHNRQSRQGRLFEHLADLTDDDGALAEWEDLGLGDFDDPGDSQ